MSIAAVRIVARLRPPLPGEACDDGVRVVSHQKVDKENAEPKSINLGPGIVVTKEGASQHFPFHSAYAPEDSTTQTLFRHDVLPLVDQVMSGRTVTVFAYGVTSSGKTYTMQGNGSEDPGVIGYVVDEIFRRINASGGTMSMSYLELYLDTPYDLLVSPSPRRKLQILSTSSAGTTSSHTGAPPLSFGTSIHLPALSTQSIESPEEFFSVYAHAAGNRSTGATLLNSNSSRSHAVLTFYVTLPDSTVGKLHLLDLAGSENNNLTGNNPSRMKESSAINTSLTALGLVVSVLNDNAKAASRAASKGEDPKLKLIPYRSSSLTRLLSDALGGSSLALLIVCLAPGTKFRSDLLRSVAFASQARRIENKAPPPRKNPEVKVPTSKSFDFTVPFRSQSSASSSSSFTVDFSSSSLTTNTPAFPSIKTELGTKPEPRTNSHSPTRPHHSRDARGRATPKKRTRRPSLIPVPATGNKSGRSSMSVVPEFLSAVGTGGVGTGFVMTEEEMQGRISKMVQAEVERRLAEIRDSERGQRLRSVKEEDAEVESEEEVKQEGKQEMDVPTEGDILSLRRESLPNGDDVSPSASSTSTSASSPNPEIPTRKRARLLTFKRVSRGNVEVKKEEPELTIPVATADLPQVHKIDQDEAKISLDADDDDDSGIDFLTDHEDDGVRTKTGTEVETEAESAIVQAEAEVEGKVVAEDILPEPDLDLQGHAVDGTVPGEPLEDLEDPEEEQVDQLIDDVDMDVSIGAEIETPTPASTPLTQSARATPTFTSTPATKKSKTPAPTPTSVIGSVRITRSGRSHGVTTSSTQSTSSSTPASVTISTSKPKRGKKTNPKPREHASPQHTSTSTSNSPVSAPTTSSGADAKQTARAWLLQGKRAQDRNELPQAIAFYQRAISFVPALNDQLKDRITAIEHAITTNTSLPPSPKRTTAATPGFKVPKVRKRGAKSTFASTWLSSSEGSASTGPAPNVVSMPSASAQDTVDLSKNPKVSKKRKRVPDNELGNEGYSNEQDHGDESSETTKKSGKIDKGKQKARAASIPVPEARLDQAEDDGQWEVPASAYANLDRMGLNEASGSGSASSSTISRAEPRPLSPTTHVLAVETSQFSPPSIALAHIERDTDPDDQMEVDEVAGTLEVVDRGSSVEPRRKETTNTKRSTPSQSIRNGDAASASGLTNIKEEEEVGPDLYVVVEADGDDGSEWEESPKKKPQTRNKKASARKSKSMAKSKSTKSTKSTKKSRESAPSEIDPIHTLGPSEQEQEQEPSDAVEKGQPSKRRRYVYDSSDEEEVFVRDTAPIKKKRLNAATRKKVLN